MPRFLFLFIGGAAPWLTLLPACKTEHDHAVSSTPVPASADERPNVYGAIADAKLASAIQESFARDPALRSQPVQVLVASGGVVTLSGTVPALATKWRAEQLVDDLKGATSVADGIRVSAPARKDAEIAEEVKDAIRSDPATRNAKVEVTASLGTVTVRGTADSYAQRELIGYAVSRVRGVQGVDLPVVISKHSSRTDAELAADVKDGFRDDARLDGTRLSVDVHGRDATISGLVGSLWQRDAAVEDAWEAGAGTVDVRGVHLDWHEGALALAAVERPPPNDAHISDAVTRKLSYDNRLGGQVPNVQVDEGVVTLAGNVMDFRAKNAADRDARRVSGVWRVEDKMTVLPATFQSDAVIEKHLTSDVYNDVALPDARNVQIVTTKAKVTLQGAVASPEEKKLIESDAEEVPGVTAVDDELKVPGYGPETHLKSAESLRHDVTEAIFWDPRIGFDNITVEVASNGDVTLNGSVASWGEAHAANDDATKAGAAHVDNRIRIAGTSPPPRSSP